MKKILPFVLIALILSSCSSAVKNKKLSELVGKYGDVSFALTDEATTYNFTTDICSDTKESGLYAESELIVSGTVTDVNELEVKLKIPMKEKIPAEESETGEEELKEVEVDVTAYIQILTFICDEVFLDKNEKAKSGDEIRILTKVSSRMWDQEAIPLFKGDECIFLLKSSDSDNDIMKIYDRGFASYLLFDSKNCVFKKTDKGYLTSIYQEFATRDAVKVNATEAEFDKLSEKEKKCYADAESYIKAMEDMYYVEDAKSAVLNNIKYYYSK